MTQRVALVAAAGVAAFVIVLLGALVTYVVLKGPDAATAVAAQSSTTASTQTQGQAQAQGQVPPAPVFGDQNGSQTQRDTNNQGGGSDVANSYSVSADEAATIALNSTPGASLVQQPRLVSVGGTVAYEVQLDKGNVYVDANSGRVLYNAADGGQGQFGRRHRGSR